MMSGLFEQRERAAETAFAHEEELRFVARQRAVQALAGWAAECMSLDADAARAYESGLIDACVVNSSDEQLVARVQTDLERAGKPTMTTQVGMVLSRALVAATDLLRGRTAIGARRGIEPLDSWEQRHKADVSWGFLRF